TMMAQKKTLSTKLDEIEARLRNLEATQTTNEFQLDGSALARVKETVSDLEKRLEVMARQAELNGRYAETGVPVIINPTRDVVHEIDSAFGQSTPGSSTKSGKSV